MWKEIILLAALSCSAQAKPVDLVPKKAAGKDLRDVNFRAIQKRSASLDARCFVDSTPISSSPFEKPGDCDHFYQCSNGYLYTMPCAEGTAYNPELQVCDHPENVTGCGKPAAVATTAVPTPPLWDNQCLDAAGHPISGDPFEKPGDCDYFYQCSNGYLHVMPCAPGTAFNPALGVCDWPYNVPGCGGSAATTTQGTTTTTQGTTTTKKPFHSLCLDAAGHPVSSEPFEKPGDCDNFYQCSNGYLHVMPCAPGTVFNPALGVCDWPYNVLACGGAGSGGSGSGNTGSTTTEGTTTTKKPHNSQCLNAAGHPVSSEPFEKPGDCDNFYQCSNGYLHVMPCAPGTVFNPALGVCDWPYNVPGCGGAGSGGSGSGNTESTTTEGTTTTRKPHNSQCLNAAGNPISSDPFEKPGDCDNFYQCSNGYLHVMPCAPGTVFDPLISVCNHPENVPGCGGSVPTTTQGTTTTKKPYDTLCLNAAGNPFSSGPFEKPGDCDHFYQCSNGYLHVMPCAPGTVFDPSISVCNHPENVPGCGGSVPTTTQGTTTTKKPYDTLCLNAAGNPFSSGPFEKPGDCDHFYQCSNGYLHVMPCAPGTVFDPSISVCNHPENVPGCGGSVPTTTQGTTTTKKPYDTLCLNAAGNPFSSGPFEKPGDCDHFYQCSNGYLHVMPCAPGTVFDPSISVCNHPENVPGCGGSVPTTTQGTTTTKKPYDTLCLNAAGNPFSSGPFEKPGDCDHFYQCSNGYLHVMPCAPGTVFDPSISVCNHPENVPGCGGSVPTTTQGTTTTKKPYDTLCLNAAGNPFSSGPFEKPGDCDHFYQCSNGYLHVMPCAPGTVFDPSISVCNHPENVPGCGGSVPTTTQGTTTTKKPYDTLCLNAAGNPFSSGPFEKPGDCDHFYQCSNGYLHVMPCAPGTVFDPSISVCNHPENVPGCGGSVPTTTQGTTTTKKPYDTLCLNAAGNPFSSGPFEKPGDCDHFYQCSNGYLHVMPCAPGTVFDPSISVCNHPENVPGCGGSVPTTTQGTTTTKKPYDTLCLNAAGNPFSSGPFEKPGDCDHFYQCSNGYLHVMPCAPGTVFDPSISVCNHPENVPGCGGSVPTTTQGTTTTKKPYDTLCLNAAGNPFSSGPFEKPGDCDHFYQCSNGYLHVMPCAPGTVFDPSISVCNHPENVPGCGGSVPTTTQGTTTTKKPYDNLCLNAAGNPISSDPFEKPGDCDHFYQCSNGYLHVMPCAPGTVFDPSISVCNHPENVPGCGGSVPTTTQGTTTTKKPYDILCLNATNYPISSDPFEKPGDCDNFYQCGAGYLYVMPCADGTSFNPNIGVCDHSYNVPGCGQVTESKCAPSQWSSWHNTHHPLPYIHSGDYETVTSIEKTHGTICQSGERIIDVRCVCAGDGQSWETTSDIVMCSKYFGLVCRNSDQTHGYGCLDYKVQFLCSSSCESHTSTNEPKCQGSNGEPLSGKPFEKPGSCTEFYQCGAGILYTMNCADGTVFNPATEKCDWPHNVPGC